MSKRIEQLLRLIADMEDFSRELQGEAEHQDATELSSEELNLVAAALSQPQPLQKTSTNRLDS